MNSTINLLLKNKQTNTTINKKQVRRLRIAAFAMLAVVAGLSTLLFIGIASSPLSSLRKQEQEAEGKLVLLKTQFAKHLLVKNQVQTIMSLLKTRSDLVKTYDILQATLLPEIKVSNLTMSESAISLSLKTSSLKSLESFLSSMKQMSESKKLLATVVVSDIAFNGEDGSYSLQISLK